MDRDSGAAITEAWLEAGRKLGVRVLGPYQVGTELYLAFLPDFGGPSGTVVAPIGATTDVATESGLYVSRVSDAYGADDLDLFRATLNDWGWYGSDADRPDWYSGQPWTD